MNLLETTTQIATSDRESTLVIRPATGADSVALERLAQLDSAVPLGGEVLLAERAGAPVAAIEVSTGAWIADPFQSTASVVAILRLRRQGLNKHPSPRRWRLHPRPKFGFGS